jgi:alkylation response protein AidB-like acyl-CoA dehydrogenase
VAHREALKALVGAVLATLGTAAATPLLDRAGIASARIDQVRDFRRCRRICPSWATRAWNPARAVRIHGGYGYSTEYDVERYFRYAPLMIVGEGTHEIHRNVIVAQLVKRGGLDRG